ncbi:MAG: amidohydrolase family protein [Gammaproteobacteria bacterium]|nr:amidohydrolase family protein [Gammaproteobacteria bacterium]MDP2141694.1 amidohydrolase family protein [Gammaproteobacteria bacterium]MDP2347929.1 amidohydrolase family protein [Gammaproteobacteria bacterium]
MTTPPAPGSDAWLALTREEIIEPDRPVIDPHHHLWTDTFNRDYLLDDFRADTGSGHRIVKTVFVECRAFYDESAPLHLQSVGETAAIRELAQHSTTSTGKAQIAGIVAHADLRLGATPQRLHEVLEKHRIAAGGLLRGIRQSGARDNRPEDLLITGRAPAYLYGREEFRTGLRMLPDYGLTYDTWHFHHQNEDFCELAQTAPDTTMILDHFGSPLGVGIYKGRQDEIFSQWKRDMAEIAKCRNVYMKLGGLAMPDNGFGWDKSNTPPGSDEIVRTQKKYYLHVLDLFGAERCMFESNFPVDRLSLSYHVLWNAFKKMVADASESEKHALFYGTAERVYRL